MAQAQSAYYLPHGSHWPIVGSIGLFSIMVGAATWLADLAPGQWIMLGGFAILLIMLIGWFGTVIGESESGAYNLQVDRSFRIAMMWFIFSEVMFFAAFFGALYYARQLALPWLGGEGTEFFTNLMLWQNYEFTWPSNGPAAIGGEYGIMQAWGLPALNTAILLSSGVTVTIAHHALQSDKRAVLAIFLAATFLLGFSFVGLQAYEYIHAFTELNLNLGSGIYGSTFFMLTGFHGAHVTIGAIMLVVIWLRCLRGHFTPNHHFAFEAVAWYWHFVDVVWLGLFIFVYWL
ncbi:MAG: cytochrome c oxidase subunit 3 [Gammaproteobacteria bacterium]